MNNQQNHEQKHKQQQTRDGYDVISNNDDIEEETHTFQNKQDEVQKGGDEEHALLDHKDSFDSTAPLQIGNNDSNNYNSIRQDPPSEVEGASIENNNHNNDNIEQQSTLHSPSKIKGLLYVSHLLSQSTEVIWQFTIILYLCFILPSSLLLVSTYGLTVGLTSVLMAGKLGSMLDSQEHRTRIEGIKWVLISHGICVMSCIGCCIAILWMQLLLSQQSHDEEDNDGQNDSTTTTTPPMPSSYQSLKQLLHPDQSHSSPYILATLLIILHLFGALTDALNQSSTVVLEKDWIVAVISHLYEKRRAEKNQHQLNPSFSSSSLSLCDEHLRDANVIMRQIDLSCKMIGPALAGVFLNFTTTTDDEDEQKRRFMWSIFVVGVLAIMALVVQYVCMKKVYHIVPRLGVRECDSGGINDDDDFYGDEGSDNGEYADDEKDEFEEEERSDSTKKVSHCAELQIYLSQTISYGGISLALLYMNVLSVGGIMTSYLLSKGLRLDLLGLWKGVASIVGLMGTASYKFSSARTSLKFTALWSVAYFLFWLSVCYGAILFLMDDNDDLDHHDNTPNKEFDNRYGSKKNMIPLVVLFIGTCASRMGLWTFDMSISQMMQELVSEDVRCAVGGTQNALESFFYMLSFGLGLIFPETEQFYVLVGFGNSAVVLSFLMVLFGVFWNNRIHI